MTMYFYMGSILLHLFLLAPLQLCWSFLLPKVLNGSSMSSTLCGSSGWHQFSLRCPPPSIHWHSSIHGHSSIHWSWHRAVSCFEGCHYRHGHSSSRIVFTISKKMVSREWCNVERGQIGKGIYWTSVYSMILCVGRGNILNECVFHDTVCMKGEYTERVSIPWYCVWRGTAMHFLLNFAMTFVYDVSVMTYTSYCSCTVWSVLYLIVQYFCYLTILSLCKNM